MVKNAATVPLVTSLPVSEYTPPVIRMSWIRAMITGIAYLGSNRIAMYAAITSSEKTIAITALLATWAPNVGPTVVVLNPFSPPFRPKSFCRAFLTIGGCPGRR